MLYLNEDFCKGCGICIDVCPKNVLVKHLGKVKVINEDKCIQCGMCENMCPDFAIHIRRGQNE